MGFNDTSPISVRNGLLLLSVLETESVSANANNLLDQSNFESKPIKPISFVTHL